MLYTETELKEQLLNLKIRVPNFPPGVVDSLVMFLTNRLRTFDQVRPSDIAKEFHISRATAGKYLTIARNILRQEKLREGHLAPVPAPLLQYEVYR